MHFRQVQSHKMGYQLQSTGKWISLQVRRKFITAKSIWNIRISIYHQWFPKLKSTYMNLICFQSVFFSVIYKMVKFLHTWQYKLFFLVRDIEGAFCPSVLLSICLLLSGEGVWPGTEGVPISFHMPCSYANIPKRLEI